MIHLSWREFFRCACVLVLFGLLAGTVQAQKVAKYGADFLAGGVGARALGMGGAYTALASDVTSGYWNAAGLAGLNFPEVAYMHAERFAGVISFDYGSAAFPLNHQSTIGISFFRSGVNDIKNTLDAWDHERDQPKPNPGDYVTSFSAADYAFYLSYARSLSSNLSIGLSGKIIQRGIGDFASAWGYSVDVGATYRAGRFLLAANIQDAVPMLQSWSVNQSALQQLEAFGDMMPQGGAVWVLPVARLGSGMVLPIGPASLTVGADVDVRFEGQRAYAFNAGDVSFHPRMGTEVSYRDVLAFRFGLNDIIASERFGTQMTPTVGVGINVEQVSIDYGFGDFAGMASDLGYSHRISLRLTLAQQRWQRASD